MPTQTAYRMTAQVGPGHRIELVAPEIIEGTSVEVIVLPCVTEKTYQGRAFLDLIASFPPGPRSAATWEEVEANLQADRDSWDR